ncbi:MAG TPA: hypothetical protein VFK97_00315 [Candidatus Saccharimonadales bacterium]|nr:hypothetical protein [Candidatus Saccharimonadales bacterium]
MKIFKTKIQIGLTLLFLAFVAWWASFQSVVTHQGRSVQWFGGTYGVVALIGAFIGFAVMRKWGGYKTILGRALLFYALGLLAQEAGQLIYTYYIYGAKIQIPYPSWGDLAYFGSVLLYIYATILLAKATGVRFSLKRKSYKLAAFLVFAVILSTSYLVFLHHHQYNWHKPLTAFLDFGYPMGQAIYISLAVTAYLLSRRMLGGIMRAGILIIILALVIQYFSDFTFLYQSSRGTWQTGHWNDLSYLVAYFVMATAMVKFNLTYRDLQRKSEKLRASAKSGVET